MYKALGRRALFGHERIAAERMRQIAEEGYTPDHDATHSGEELPKQAVALASPQGWTVISRDGDFDVWGLAKKHESDRVRQLEIAGALIAAEIDRLTAVTPQTHELRTWPKAYEDVASGAKSFELRLDDRGYKTGDVLVLKEYDPDRGVYSGRSVRAVVTCVYSGFGLLPNHVALGIRLVP